MKNKKLIWIPRIIIILYILFISLFALDTKFGIGFFVHLIPSFIPLAILVFTWKKQKIAGISFGLFGVGTIIFFETYKNIFSFLTISLIPIIAGILFWILGRKK